MPKDEKKGVKYKNSKGTFTLKGGCLYTEGGKRTSAAVETSNGGALKRVKG